MRACVDTLARIHAMDEYPAVWPPDPGGWLTPTGLIAAWIATRAEIVTGHVALSTCDAELVSLCDTTSNALLEIKRLYVAPEVRGTGLAQALLETAAAAATARGCRPLLEVAATSGAAIALYERSGWRRIGRLIATWSTATGDHPEVYVYTHEAAG